MKEYIRRQYHDAMLRMLQGTPNLLQVVVGPRQVGKTTLALQIRERWKGPTHYETADRPDTPSAAWIDEQWRCIRAREKKRRESLLILDEVQKIPRWSTTVKKLFDEDRRAKRRIRVILLGSSSLLMQHGLTESLAGRFELHRHAPWSFRECREYFGVSPEEYLFFGGYPVGLALRGDEERWARYMRDALIETVLSKDLLLLAPVRKPALLRQTFGIAVTHPAEILSYQKMLGTLQDAGNTTTIASYLQLLSQAFLIVTLDRWSGSRVRRRGSQPKIVVLDNGIVSAMAGRSRSEWRSDTAMLGKMVENAVGAQLHILLQDRGGELFYWRERKHEVDYVVHVSGETLAIEVKKGACHETPPSLAAFCRKNEGTRGIILAGEDTRLQEDTIEFFSLAAFLSDPQQIL